ncbi:MAG: hypothetical protein NT154_28225 [Verrucomicrobia bacterium]|nr:hypothetical protein [Verrucomicrobiota bacterium]
MRTSNIKFVLSLALSAGFMLSSGCAAEPVKPASQPKSQPAVAAAPPPVAASEPKDILPPDVVKPAAPFEGEGWESMFDGRSLAGWRETQFAGRGAVRCQDGVVVAKMGDPFTGINWTNTFPKMNYEVAFDAMRLIGSDFFCALTVPVGTNF